MSKVARSHGNSMFNLLRNCQTVFLLSSKCFSKKQKFTTKLICQTQFLHRLKNDYVSRLNIKSLRIFFEDKIASE